MKKGVTFFVFICLLVFGVSACGRENVSDPSEGKKASAENPKTTDRSSEESEQTSEQTEASVSAEEHSGQTDIQKPVKKDILIAIDPGHQSPDIDMSGQEPNAPGSGDFKQKSAGGTVGRFTGIPEYELNLEIALMLRDRLCARRRVRIGRSWDRNSLRFPASRFVCRPQATRSPDGRHSAETRASAPTHPSS